MGWDPNKVVAIPNAKEERRQIIKKMYGFVEEDNTVEKEKKPFKRAKGYVMEQMEADANALRESNFRLVLFNLERKKCCKFPFSINHFCCCCYN